MPNNSTSTAGGRGRLAFIVLIAIGLLAAPSASATFTPVTGSPFATGSGGASSVAAGDLNHDGALDLAVANTNIPGKVSVLLGDGSGDFTAAAGSPVSYSGGGFPTGVAVGNFNGDDDLDVAISDAGSSAVWILLGNGLGGLSVTPNISTGGVNTFGIAVGKINGDAFPDFVAANLNTSDVSVLLGDGAGGASPAAGSPFASGGTGTRSVAIGHLNGDAYPDIAAANTTSNDISVLLGNGSGAMTPAGGSPIAGGDSNLFWVAIGDLTNDLNNDLVTANQAAPGTASVLLGNGLGAFTPAAGSPVPVGGNGPMSVAITNLDADANLDFAASIDGAGTLGLLLGDGLGAFTPATGSPVASGGTAARQVIAADLNGDGNPDLATAVGIPSSVSVLLNLPAISITPASPVSFGTQPQATFGAAQAITATNTDPIAPLAITDVRLTGTNRDDFLISSDDCEGERIPPAGTCDVRVRFGPGSSGAKTAALQLTDNAPASPQSVTLMGTAGALPTGPTGSTGPQGATGPQGPPGRDATVTCKSKGKKKVKCTVTFAAASGVKRASLSRGGATVAQGKPAPSGGKLVLRFASSRPLKAGRYTLTVVQRLNGNRVVTKSAVRVR